MENKEGVGIDLLGGTLLENVGRKGGQAPKFPGAVQ